ncbi:MAG: quinone-dependent dihydroorotate dehydrogenase [Elusimicrobia bacterium]|nr:quinone-dependent dihydroorotate dehydrogenase [Elusimicrobiota bacterium]
MLYDSILRPALFGLDAERAHDSVVNLLCVLQRMPLGYRLLSLAEEENAPSLQTEVLGLKFPNPVGLAAGFDKDCRMAGILPALGFGFLELGSITLRPQPGNPRPRLFRVVGAEAIINRMGFNGEGALPAAGRLEALGRSPVPLGINLGLNKDCPHDGAPRDYAETFRILEPFGDYFAVNVSSPNTLGLRALQEKLHLERILRAIQDVNTARKPVLVKIDPDMPPEHLKDLAALLACLAAGVIVSNTTLSRDGVPGDWAMIRGGLSGKPLRDRSTRLVAEVYRLTEGKLTIVGVGGIFTGADAYDKIRAGASLVEVYTGLVYGGPGAVRRIRRELAACLERDGHKSIGEAVGKGHGPG